MKLALFAFLLSHGVHAAVPAPGAPHHSRGGLVQKAQSDEDEEVGGNDMWEMVGCSNEESECRRMARRRGYSEWRASDELSSCKSTIYSCYGK